MCFIFIVSLLHANSLSTDKKAQRSVKQFEKKVEDAEKFIGKGDFKHAGSRIRAAERIYKKIPSEYYSDPKVQNLKRRYDAVFAKVSAKQGNKKADKYIERFEKKIEDAESRISSGDFINANRRLTDADRLYNKIPGQYRSDPKVKDLRSRYDSALAKVKKDESDRKAKNEEFDTLLRLSSEFNREAGSLGKSIDGLIKAKKNETIDMFDLKKFYKSNPALDSFAKDCEGKYSLLIEKKPDKQAYYQITVAEVAELMKNRKKYSEILVETSIKKYIDDKVALYNKIITEFKSSQIVGDSTYEALGSEFDKKINEMSDAANEGYQFINKPVPPNLLDQFKELHPAFMSTFKQVLAANRRNSKFYKNSSRAMKELGVDAAKKYGFKLIAIGAKDNRWTIVRNKLTGFPIRRYIYGYVLFQKKGESYLRRYSIRLVSEYNGSKYLPVSSYTLTHRFTPVRRK